MALRPRTAAGWLLPRSLRVCGVQSAVILGVLGPETAGGQSRRGATLRTPAGDSVVQALAKTGPGGSAARELELMVLKISWKKAQLTTRSSEQLNL